MRDHVQDIAHNIAQSLVVEGQIQHQHGDRFLHRPRAVVAAHEKIDGTRRELRPLEPVRALPGRRGAAVPLRQVRRVACVGTTPSREARALSGGNIDDVAATRASNGLPPLIVTDEDSEDDSEDEEEEGVYCDGAKCGKLLAGDAEVFTDGTRDFCAACKGSKRGLRRALARDRFADAVLADMSN